ncbi:MAG: alpha/beta hydrolase [Candidatus Omnitrophica bacterium]|nr:alpha/beta hydrolase [Candidatus Omnitrophota bacterium]MBU4473507.1 alpha/beta hydrolase [Candidatus Omnitrophota bacterium]MCG2706843.1 alpha/beta hydrolase [Candidatus Omnitrophota bacterium]
MFKGIVYIAIALVFLMGYIKYIELCCIFFPVKEVEFTPAFIGLAFEDVYIETRDNIKINSWFIPHSNARYTILFFHGNAGNIADRLDKIGLLNHIGLNLLIIDYRGFGRSQGRPSEGGLYLDARAAYDYLVNERKIKPQDIILYGESLGGAVAINLASELKARPCILEGTFSRGRDMAKKMYPFLPALLFPDIFDSLEKIKGVQGAKLFIHSQDDEIVPINLARKLFNAGTEPKYFVEINGGHNEGFLDSQERYSSTITSFIGQL